jgi:hypothetical protein
MASLELRRIYHHPIGVYLLLNAASLLLVFGTSKGVEALPAVNSFRQKNHHRQNFILNEKNNDVQELFLEQPLDHFATDYKDKYPNATLHQRYFYTSRYVNQKNESFVPMYVFLCIGGEGPYLDRSVLWDSVHCTGDMLDLAKILYEVCETNRNEKGQLKICSNNFCDCFGERYIKPVYTCLRWSIDIMDYRIQV